MDVSLVVRFINHLQEGIASTKRDLKAFSADVAHLQKETNQHFQKWFDPQHLEDATKNAEMAFSHARGRMVGAIAQTATLIAPLYKAMQFDQSMKGLEKVLDAPLHRLKELRRFALETSTTIPLAAREVLELMTSASQAGIGEQDLEAFSIYAAKAAVAFDMTEDQIGERFAKLRNVFKLNQKGIEDLGDAINHVSNHMAAKANEVSDFTNRATGSATMFQLTARETVMGLMRTHPFIVVKVGDKAVHEVFYQRLLTATITDHAGNEADRFEAEFDDSGHDLEVPEKTSTLQVVFDYQDSVSAFMGRFIVESIISLGGSDGEILRLCGKSASM